MYPFFRSSSDLSGAFKLVMVGDSGVGKSCLLEKGAYKYDVHNALKSSGMGRGGGSSSPTDVICVCDPTMKLVSGGGSKNAFISTIGVDVRTHQIDLSEGHSCKLQASIRINWTPVLIQIV